MSAVVLLSGQVRDVRDRRKKSEPGESPGEVWGRSVKILTEFGSVLGDTLDVTVFNADRVVVAAGELVEWIVEVSANSYGLQAVFKAEAKALALK